MSELNAAFGRFQLLSWGKQEWSRRRNYEVLVDHLNGVPAVRTFPACANVSPFVFPVRVAAECARNCTQALRSAGIEARSLMGGALHSQRAYRHLAHERLMASERIGSEGFFLGIHQTLTEEQILWGARQARDILQREARC